MAGPCEDALAGASGSSMTSSLAEVISAVWASSAAFSRRFGSTAVEDVASSSEPTVALRAPVRRRRRTLGACRSSTGGWIGSDAAAPFY